MGHLNAGAADAEACAGRVEDIRGATLKKRIAENAIRARLKIVRASSQMTHA